MRDIKFRAWDIESPAMLSWDEIQEQWMLEGYSQSILRSDHYVLMQFTGLKDKNGKDIYEGDIVEYAYDSMGAGRLSWIREVACGDDGRYHMVGAQLQSNPWGAISGTFGAYVEVVDDIYNNPKLLTEVLV